MGRKIIISEEQFDFIVNNSLNKQFDRQIVAEGEENPDICYIGSFFVMESPEDMDFQEFATSLSEVTIGSFMNQYDVIVYTNDPGNIPHLHVLSHNTNKPKVKVDACVRLDVPEYFPHGNHSTTLSTKQKKAFINFLKMPRVNRFFNGTNFEYAVMIWNDNNSSVEVTPEYDSNNNVIIPDYTKL